MMRIIKPGTVQPKEAVIHCESCSCEFAAFAHEAMVIESNMWRLLRFKCPSCGFETSVTPDRFETAKGD